MKRKILNACMSRFSLLVFHSALFYSFTLKIISKFMLHGLEEKQHSAAQVLLMDYFIR